MKEQGNFESNEEKEQFNNTMQEFLANARNEGRLTQFEKEEAVNICRIIYLREFSPAGITSLDKKQVARVAELIKKADPMGGQRMLEKFKNLYNLGALI